MNGRRQQSKRKTLLPKDTASILEDRVHVENLYLQLYRYTYMEEYNNSVIKKIKLYFPYTNSKSLDVYRPILSNLDKRIQKVWKPLKIQDNPFIISQQSRWAIGIGGVSPYGNLLLPTLHPLYGIPYLPASTLKGLMRHCWIDINCNGNEKAEEVLRLFGSSADEASNDELNSDGRTGQLIFFDSYPDVHCNGKLVKDVFTPHYPNYYKNFGTTSPTDDQIPVPIEFFCIEDFTFNIYIGACEKLSDDEKIMLQKTLVYVFSEQGVGAKTALGYGRGLSR